MTHLVPLYDNDRIIFEPGDVDLSRSPMRRHFDDETYVLGAFNPGFTRLANGNLLLMVRVAEGLRKQIGVDHVKSLRWSEGKFVIDRFGRADVDDSDPRALALTGHAAKTHILTSLSWLLPVELSADGSKLIAAHYDRAIAPRAEWQQYGVEDARISRVGDSWYMTACSVSAGRHSTALYTSSDALDWKLEGIVLDHQNKDMLIFEGKVGGKFIALTRPMGEVYFAWPPDSPWLPGPAILMAESPDALHWKPVEDFGIRPSRDSRSSVKVGGGAPPVLTDTGWLVLYHGVGPGGVVGAYRTFWALLDRDDPTRILRLEDKSPVLESRPGLIGHDLAKLRYVTHIVFTTGIVNDGDHWLIASGEDDLACRLTRIPQSRFD